MAGSDCIDCGPRYWEPPPPPPPYSPTALSVGHLDGTCRGVVVVDNYCYLKTSGDVTTNNSHSRTTVAYVRSTVQPPPAPPAPPPFPDKEVHSWPNWNSGWGEYNVMDMTPIKQTNTSVADCLMSESDCADMINSWPDGGTLGWTKDITTTATTESGLCINLDGNISGQWIFRSANSSATCLASDCYCPNKALRTFEPTSGREECIEACDNDAACVAMTVAPTLNTEMAGSLTCHLFPSSIGTIRVPDERVATSVKPVDALVPYITIGAGVACSTPTLTVTGHDSSQTLWRGSRQKRPLYARLNLTISGARIAPPIGPSPPVPPPAPLPPHMVVLTKNVVLGRTFGSSSDLASTSSAHYAVDGIYDDNTRVAEHLANTTDPWMSWSLARAQNVKFVYVTFRNDADAATQSSPFDVWLGTGFDDADIREGCQCNGNVTYTNAVAAGETVVIDCTACPQPTGQYTSLTVARVGTGKLGISEIDVGTTDTIDVRSARSLSVNMISGATAGLPATDTGMTITTDQVLPLDGVTVKIVSVSAGGGNGTSCDPNTLGGREAVVTDRNPAAGTFKINPGTGCTGTGAIDVDYVVLAEEHTRLRRLKEDHQPPAPAVQPPWVPVTVPTPEAVAIDHDVTAVVVVIMHNLINRSTAANLSTPHYYLMIGAASERPSLRSYLYGLNGGVHQNDSAATQVVTLRNDYSLQSSWPAVDGSALSTNTPPGTVYATFDEARNVCLGMTFDACQGIHRDDDDGAVGFQLRASNTTGDPCPLFGGFDPTTRAACAALPAAGGTTHFRPPVPDAVLADRATGHPVWNYVYQWEGDRLARENYGMLGVCSYDEVAAGGALVTKAECVAAAIDYDRGLDPSNAITAGDLRATLDSETGTLGFCSRGTHTRDNVATGGCSTVGTGIESRALCERSIDGRTGIFNGSDCIYIGADATSSADSCQPHVFVYNTTVGNTETQVTPFAQIPGEDTGFFWKFGGVGASHLLAERECDGRVPSRKCFCKIGGINEDNIGGAAAESPLVLADGTLTPNPCNGPPSPPPSPPPPSPPPPSPPPTPPPPSPPPPSPPPLPPPPSPPPPIHPPSQPPPIHPPSTPPPSPPPTPPPPSPPPPSPPPPSTPPPSPPPSPPVCFVVEARTLLTQTLPLY